MVYGLWFRGVTTEEVEEVKGGLVLIRKNEEHRHEHLLAHISFESQTFLGVWNFSANLKLN